MNRLFLLALVWFATGWRAYPAENPNVIFILADDLGIGNVGCSDRIATRHRKSTIWRRMERASRIATPRRCADRGRAYAETGDKTKAEADFAAALSYNLGKTTRDQIAKSREGKRQR